MKVYCDGGLFDGYEVESGLLIARRGHQVLLMHGGRESRYYVTGEKKNGMPIISINPCHEDEQEKSFHEIVDLKTLPNQKEARKLRDKLYGKQSDGNWAYCAEHWVDDLEWLKQQVKK